jgi:DNA-binding XRE family transcriptional regulator
MADEWIIEYFVEDNGRVPVREFLQDVDKETYARFLWSLEQVRVRNVMAHEPLVRHIEGKIWEIREESHTNIYRILYGFLLWKAYNPIAWLCEENSETSWKRDRHCIETLNALLRARKQGMKTMAEIHYSQKDGRSLFEEDKARFLANPASRAIYEAEARKKELWLQLVEARQAAGLTQQELAQRLGVSQAQISRIERRGYQGYTLKTLQRYVEALGGQFMLNVTVERIAS